ncbi:MAG: alpha-D-glucose phosphate-specific phosphoglucomutase, partial [Novosphingobium sp.]
MHPRAGQTALAEDLIDLDALLGAYESVVPDMGDPGQRVVFGTSGHRGSSLDGAFNQTHILAIAQSIADYRAAQGIDGPLFVGRDTHALSEPAFRTTIQVLVANGVEVLI